ncbi:MAG: lasso peptide biosynthesis B2 protein [Pelomonas sp.]|nr:lasso peptide biosynthesis B2 protein [Roseateles sp.]
MAPLYRLADHVCACRVDEQVVLLDLKRNKYMGIGGPLLGALADAVVDWPTRSATSLPTAPSPCLHQGLHTLLEQRMLTITSDAGAGRASIDAARASMLPDVCGRSVLSESRHLPSLLLSAAVAAHWLSRCSLANIRVRVIRERQDCHRSKQSPEGDMLRAAVAAYTHLRPFVLTAHDQCLHDSLTLIRFLAKQGVFARWVIGVRTRPFGAHSWVQSGNTVLNDVHENVRAYTPIMVV